MVVSSQPPPSQRHHRNATVATPPSQPSRRGPVPELDRRHRLLVLVICCSSLFVVSMDVTIVNLALPAIRDDLSASVTSLQWTIDAYTLTLASLLMLAGSTADRVGRRRVFRIGLVLFGLGSLLCSVAPSAGALVGFR